MPTQNNRNLNVQETRVCLCIGKIFSNSLLVDDRELKYQIKLDSSRFQFKILHV